MSDNIYINYVNDLIDDKSAKNMVTAISKLDDITVELRQQYKDIIDQLKGIDSLISNMNLTNIESDIGNSQTQVTAMAEQFENEMKSDINGLTSQQVNMSQCLTEIEEKLQIAMSNSDQVNSVIQSIAAHPSWLGGNDISMKLYPYDV